MSGRQQIEVDRVICGDCLDVLRSFPDNSVDAVVTDPPYGLNEIKDLPGLLRAWLEGEDGSEWQTKGFMGKGWDKVPPPSVWREVLRVMKPGAYILCFAGCRTVDLMGISLRLAGFEDNNLLAWLQGQGFPKATDVGKMIDKRGGKPLLAPIIAKALKEARERRGISITEADRMFCGGTTNYSWFEGRPAGQRIPSPKTFAKIAEAWPELAPLAEMVKEAQREVVGKRPWTNSAHHFVPGKDHTRRVRVPITAPATPEAKKWDGWKYGKQALKPAMEPILLMQKPFEKGLAGYQNVLKWARGR